MTSDASRYKLGKAPSRLGEIRSDVSAASFTALLDQAKVAGPSTHNFYDSGEVRPPLDVALHFSHAACPVESAVTAR